MSTARPGRVVIVGGGAIGAACAHWLLRSGVEVEIVDQGSFGAACSTGNCGLISPSHVLPLCTPGAITATLPLLLRRNSPFAVRPRLDPTLLAWFTRFALNCRADKAWRTAAALHALLDDSRTQYEAMAVDDGIEFEFQARGCLFATAREQHLDAFAATNEEIRSRFGFAAERLDGRALVAKEPAIVDGLAGAWFFPNDGHFRPDRLMASWRASLERRGAKVREGCAVSAIDGRGGRASGVATAQGAIRADAVVIATGSWTPLLRDLIGVRVPIQPGKGYSLTSALPEGAPTTPIIFEDARVAVTPMRTGYRLGSTMEFAGYDSSIREARLDLLRSAARRYLRIPYQPATEERWFGWRPMTPDGLPFIDVSPRWSNVFVAAGHNMIGMSTAPATGRLVASLLCGEKPEIDPGPYRLAGRT